MHSMLVKIFMTFYVTHVWGQYCHHEKAEVIINTLPHIHEITSNITIYHKQVKIPSIKMAHTSKLTITSVTHN